ncbi:MAG: methylenetetrahydrofolate reductase, partial [Coriobacteriales bacterium]|nr:methylenetetrahydrofolate reductase [Coriobacteriales bacterium]
MTNRLREAVEKGEFAVTVELIPGRGAAEPAQVKEFEEMAQIYATGRVHAISITDNPGGNPALLADALAHEFFDSGITPLVHTTCKDRNRNQIQAQMYALQRQGVENLLCMSGDYVVSGWRGRSRPVFDLDPVQLLQLANNMNQGLVQKTPRGEVAEQPASFFPGAVVNPFKYTEAEVVTQYFKLEKKIAAGARFIIIQLGYDARKMDELLVYLKERHYDVPVIANIFLLNAGAAKLMRKGAIAGCHISDELLRTLEQEGKSEDKGKSARLLRAAKMIAIARGMGYAGIHIGGFGLTAAMVESLLDQAETLQSDWRLWAQEIQYAQPGGFYLYEPTRGESGEANGFNTNVLAPRNERKRGKKIMRGYGISRFFHYWVLTKGKRFGKVLAGSMDRRERKRGMNRHHR